MTNLQSEEVGAGAANAGLPTLLPLLRRRSVLFSIAAVAILVGLALYWNSLVALGIAPILIGLLPCLAMCALGLCMNRGSGDESSCHGRTATPETPPDGTDPSR